MRHFAAALLALFSVGACAEQTDDTDAVEPVVEMITGWRQADREAIERALCNPSDAEALDPLVSALAARDINERPVIEAELTDDGDELTWWSIMSVDSRYAAVTVQLTRDGDRTCVEDVESQDPLVGELVDPIAPVGERPANDIMAATSNLLNGWSQADYQAYTAAFCNPEPRAIDDAMAELIWAEPDARPKVVFEGSSVIDGIWTVEAIVGERRGEIVIEFAGGLDSWCVSRIDDPNDILGAFVPADRG